MDMRQNDVFYRALNKPRKMPIAFYNADTEMDLPEATAASASSKILLCAYKTLIQHFNQLDTGTQKNWQLEINIIARQLAHLFKQSAKYQTTNGYPSLSLLKEIRDLDKSIMANTLATV